MALIATIEFERDQHRNPQVADHLAADYAAEIKALPAVLGTHPSERWDELVVQYAVACIALARGQRWLARAHLELDRDTAGRRFSDEFGWKIPNDQ